MRDSKNGGTARVRCTGRVMDDAVARDAGHPLADRDLAFDIEPVALV